MGSFLSSIFGGSNPTLNGDIGNAGNIMNFGTSVGEGDTRNASDFFNTLLAGDPAKTSKLLSPEIKDITDQGQQAKKTMAQFGTRSGGTTSAASTIDDKTRGSIDDMIAKLTFGAASGDASLGTSLLNTGLSANQLQDEESQQKLQNMINSILGQGVSGAVGSAEGFGLGKMFPAK
jgi:hypothetical protein